MAMSEHSPGAAGQRPSAAAMVEPEANPSIESHDNLEIQPTSPPAVSPAANVWLAGLSLLGSPDPSDNAPTIVSRTPQSPPGKDDPLAAGLRGRRLAHFELLEPIGVGGMAAVIRARDVQLDRTVALKILPPEVAGDPELVRRFHQEARAAAKLDHENIARVFFCGEDQGLNFIAFEFVEGENLRALVDRHGPVSVRDALSYLVQIAGGLVHASTRGVVHRDIKPSNIIITPAGRAKLVDMGLARSVESQGDEVLTQPGGTLGTYDYISPEQALEPHDADSRSDIYSLGCTFYHVLTGQPPVPDGTAAKKLHYHQRIDPIDPRQFNPEIPDELTLILARMMAKDPAGRYPGPEHLLSNLLALVHQLGYETELPKLPLPADAQIPSAPRPRPFLTAVAAVLALVLLIVVLRPGSWPSSSKPDASGDSQALQSADRSQTPTPPEEAVQLEEDSGIPAPVQTATSIDKFSGADVKKLAAFLRSKSSARVALSGDLKLNHEDQLSFEGSDLTIEPDNPDERPVIQLRYYPSPLREPWAALTVKRGKVRIRGIRFVVDATEAPDIVMTAVTQQGGQLELENCEFVQNGPPATEQSHVSSIGINAQPTGDQTPFLKVYESYFAGGQHAMTVEGAATVESKQCAFAPHTAALFDLQTPFPREGSARLTMQNCSMILDGSVFRISGREAATVDVENCLFSRLKADSESQTPNALIEQIGDLAGEWQYVGKGNRYHNLQVFWVKKSGAEIQEAITDLDAFRLRFGRDEGSLVLSSSPWQDADPRRLLKGDPGQAFRLNTALAQLRQSREQKRMVGVDRCVWGKSYREELPTLEEKNPVETVRSGEKIVDPTITIPKDNVYRTLRQAFEETKPGDVILIKHNKELAIEPVHLERAGMDVTVKPYPDHHPVLTLGSTREREAFLFRVYDGQLQLEGLEFHLMPGRAEFSGQTVAAIIGDGRCTLKNCAVTLEAKDVPLSVVTLADPSAVMRMDPQSGQQEPRIQIDGCFVRGTGSLVTVRASRPFNLSIEESLVALDGSLVVVDANSKDPASKEHAEIALKQVTTYLTDHLVWLRASKEDGKASRGLVLTQVKSADCLFASAVGKSLIHLDGVDTEAEIRRFLSWGGSQHNAYSNFNQFLDQQPRGEGDVMAPPAYGQNKWEDFTQESHGRFDRVKFNSPPAPAAPMARVAAADFRTKAESNMQGYGVDVDRLPKPTDDESSSGLKNE
jgi:serine/threonine protein kinase